MSATIMSSALFALLCQVANSEGVGDPSDYERRKPYDDDRDRRYQEYRDQKRDSYQDRYNQRDTPPPKYDDPVGGIGATEDDHHGLFDDMFADDHDDFGSMYNATDTGHSTDEGTVEEFKQVDTNNDGVMDAQEIRIEHPEVGQKDLFEFYQQCDKNGDGVISLPEYEDFLLANS